MKVALYARCSTDIQENLDRSVPAQLSALRDYAEKHEYIIYKEYLEPGESAYSEDENREKFHEMIKAAKEGKFGIILVHRYNRFYRDQYKSMFYKKILRDCKVRVISITEELDPESIQGFMLERMIEMMDQVQSMQNAWETFKGMKENALQGYKNGGRVPYGYKRIQIPVDINRPNPKFKIKWEIDPEKAKVVKKIFELRCQDQSLRKISDYLNYSMIPSPNGKFWDISTVRYFLMRSDVYAGDYIWNLWNKKVRGQKFNDKKDWVVLKDAHPAIIDRETAAKAKVPIGSSNNKKYMPPIFSRFILTGKNIYGDKLFTCRRCGANYIGYGMTGRGMKQYPKYICSNYHKKGRIACKGDPFYISKEWLEKEVIEEIKDRYENINGTEDFIKKIKEDNKKIKSERKNTLKEINSEIRRINNQIDSLATAIFNGLDKKIYVPKSKELSDKLEKLEEIKKQIIEEENSNNDINLDNVLKIFKNFKELIKKADFREKHLAITTFLKKITVEPESKKIYLDFFQVPKNILTTNGVGARDRI